MNEQQKIPYVSIIIATYNLKEYLWGSIKSACLQDYPHEFKEVVVIDDCSTDNSIKDVAPRCSQFNQHDEDKEKIIYRGLVGPVNISYLRLKENGGPSRARNIGIKYCWERTNVFGVLDSDDMFKQGKISKCVMKFIADPELTGIVFTDYDILNTSNNTITYESRPPYNLFELRNNFTLHSGMFFSKRALEQVGLYDEELRTCEDFDLALRIADHFMIYQIPEDLSIIRVQPKNSTDTVSKDTWEKNYRRVKEKMFMRMQGTTP